MVALMAKPLRYTGCWPPVDILDEYPKWVLATDEEGEPDQDETTIKPENQQAFISDETDFSVAFVSLANGTTARGVLSFINGKVDAVDVFDGRDWWRIRSERGGWISFADTWVPAEQRRPSVSLSDENLFPAQVNSRLPGRSGMAVTFTIPLGPDRRVKAKRPWYRFW
jgi:hypothetical protein